MSVCSPLTNCGAPSGLIEGHAAELPLSESLDRYLSFPLRGLYRVVDNKGEVIEPRALVGDGTSWAVQLRAAGRAASSESVVWIVYRGSPAAFDKNLHDFHCNSMPIQ
ncbi:MAG: hypothetical protein R3C56_04890 [Pirellulaceae bacterium]